MLLVNILFVAYFLILLLFSLFSHPVCYCILLLVNAIISGSICYVVFGFSWYTLLFFLVYIGGVYVLFVFVSVYSPNSSYLTYFSLNFFMIFMSVFGAGVVGLVTACSLFEVEFSHFLCTRNEGVFYVVVCLMLLFGFLVLSMIMSVKINYYR
uniref:NADH dehydrogenase subunit 6 n=1 Tax=Moniezia sp. MN-2015 TaxID=1768671 RepID=A0A7R6SZL3_9CEST|nr:NADH dehydrogenase subunit 6 [Moniezia sp. MN-2015]